MAQIKALMFAKVIKILKKFEYSGTIQTHNGAIVTDWLTDVYFVTCHSALSKFYLLLLQLNLLRINGEYLK